MPPLAALPQPAWTHLPLRAPSQSFLTADSAPRPDPDQHRFEPSPCRPSLRYFSLLPAESRPLPRRCHRTQVLHSRRNTWYTTAHSQTDTTPSVSYSGTFFPSWNSPQTLEALLSCDKMSPEVFPLDLPPQTKFWRLPRRPAPPGTSLAESRQDARPPMSPPSHFLSKAPKSLAFRSLLQFSRYRAANRADLSSACPRFHIHFQCRPPRPLARHPAPSPR